MTVQTDIPIITGGTARMCEHNAELWPVFAKLARVSGHGQLGIWQAQGGAGASADTHLDGTAVDVNNDSVDCALLARECGYDASWPRGPQYRQAFMAHGHYAVRCPCNPNRAAYQNGAVRRGYNGLGRNGTGGPDYVPRPSRWRDWAEGLEWAKQQLSRLQPVPPPAEDKVSDMFLAFTAGWDDTAPDKGGGKVCLVVPGRVVWLDPERLDLWLRALPESMTKFRGSPFLWVQLERMANDMVSNGSREREHQFAALVPNGDSRAGATVDDLKGLLA